MQFRVWGLGGGAWWSILRCLQYSWWSVEVVPNLPRLAQATKHSGPKGFKGSRVEGLPRTREIMVVVTYKPIIELSPWILMVVHEYVEVSIQTVERLHGLHV